MTTASEIALTTWLDAAAGYAPEYAGGLSNHLPMALIALERLGGDARRLAAFNAGYVTRLAAGVDAAHTPVSGWTNENVAQILGHIESYDALRRFFLEDLTRQGVDRVMRRALPLLLPGVGAAAFHGLIRTAYGVDAGHVGEIAAGLAYWGARYLPLVAHLPPVGALAADAWLSRIDDAFRHWTTGPGLITRDMQAVASDPEFRQRLGGLRVDGSTLASLARIAARRYSATRDFTVLHLVTSAHALSLLLPFAEERDPAVHWYAVSYAAAFASAAAQPVAPVDPNSALAWPEIVAKARESNNDHVVKLVYTCRELERIHSGTEFRLAASERVR